MAGIEKALFGFLPNGEEVYAYTLRNRKGMSVKILNYGGVIVELLVPDRHGRLADVVGGYDDLSSYLEGDGYQGALIGRVCNRIAKGRFFLEGKEYCLFQNDGANHLHGGRIGFSGKLWKGTEIDGEEPELRLSLISPHGDEGYSGSLEVTVSYRLTEQNGLVLRYVARTDRTTVINLTNHSYFNLRGVDSESVLTQTLWLDADTYLPTDEELIPTGELRRVEGTPFDFRCSKEIGRDIDEENEDLKRAGGYDHCLCFRGPVGREPRRRGELYDQESGRVMTLFTNQPCVQLYTGNFLGNPRFPFKGGIPQRPRALLCLETQRMPDSVHHSDFTDCTLRPGEIYDYTTEYRFSVR